MKTARRKVSQKLKGLYLRGSIWWLTWRHNGQKYSISLKTGDYAEAVQLALKVKSAPQFARTDRISDLAERFLREKTSSGHFCRKTREWAVTPLKRLEKFLGNMGMAAVTLAELKAFWLELRQDQLSDTSAASYMRAVRSFFSWAEASQRILFNPCLGLKLPKVAQAARQRFCSAALRDKLLGDCAERDLRFVLFAGFHAGLRRNEICEARPEWFDLERGFLHVGRTATFTPKDRERRSVPLTRAFGAFLAEAPLGSPFVLKPDVPHGRALYRYDFRVPFTAYMAAHGCLWVTPHVMRHTFATLYMSAGGSLYRLAKYLGDTPETTEKHYGHLVPNRDDIERGHG